VFTGRGVDVLVCRSTGESLIRATRAAPCVAADGLGEFRGDVGRVGGLGVWTTGTETDQRLARTFAYVDARTVDVEAQCDESITGPTVPGA
jgi:hypothetical protein